MTVVFCWSVRV